MELRHLKTFAAAAERGSFTRAAEALELTQAAVSQQVAALEKGLSAQLFQRQGRGVQLTEPGRKLYAYARQILDLVDEASRQVGETEEELCGVLRIATSTVPSEWLLPELLAEFRNRWPQVRESLVVSDSRLATAAVEAGEADVGFVGELPRSSTLHAQAVAEDELVLVVGAEHPLAGKGTTTLKQLCREALIVREPGSGSRRCVERALEEHGISPADLNIAMEVNSNDAIRAAVEQGVGVAFFSQRAIRKEGNIATIKVRGFRPRRQLYLIRNPDRNPTPPARQFLAFVKEWRSAHFAKRRRSANK
ncbi:MAG: selenium metabolism-associated LysR family transcriptional regulator [Planctomycetota bacterium]|nr:selenium metabolism-associated LysR family transcriptional regulator [Planctomycetota bacterium]